MPAAKHLPAFEAQV